MSGIFTTPLSAVYLHYVAKAERRGRSQAEVDDIVCWLTGFSNAELRGHLSAETTFVDFFAAATLHPNAAQITGTVCGVRVHEVTDPLMRLIRYLDKLIDELAKGKAMDKIRR